MKKKQLLGFLRYGHGGKAFHRYYNVCRPTTMNEFVCEKEEEIMKNSHLLLEKATTYPIFRGELAPEKCEYDPLIGAWIYKPTSELFVETSFCRGPRTKKQDIETGEDQKSE